MDGLAATRLVRQLEGPLAKIPIIMLTAHSMAGDSEQCMEAGADAYLSKPLEPQKLVQATAYWSEVGEKLVAEQDSIVL
jgi:CheY-like chemotaxis protein